MKNRGRTQDPHTLSLVRQKDLPTGFSADFCVVHPWTQGQIKVS